MTFLILILRKTITEDGDMKTTGFGKNRRKVKFFTWIFS